MINISFDEVKEKLTIDNIRILVEIMGGIISYEDDDIWITNTFCHGGKKNKLYFYKDSKTFYCYSECGYMDIFRLVSQVYLYTNNEAKDWICKTLKFDEIHEGFGIDECVVENVSEWNYINKLKNKFNKKCKENKTLDVIPMSTLNMFQHLYHKSWIDEGISIKSMNKYKILYSTWQQKIVIPHFDKNNNLVGIRGRSVIEDEIELFGKYSPLKTGNVTGKKFYNHELGLNLYGLNMNETCIRRKRKLLLVESEKSVLQTDTMFGEDNFTLAICGSNLTKEQIKLILELNVLEVIIGLDKQFKEIGDEECIKWEKKIRDKFVTPLAPYVKVSVLWDTENLLDYKDSPTDKGKEILLKLMDNKIYGHTLTI